MRALLVILLLAVTFQAQEISIPRNCKAEVDTVAGTVTDIVHDFTEGFNIIDLAGNAVKLYHEQAQLREVCEHHMWEAIIDVVLESVEPELHGCALKVVVTIQDSLELIELFVDGHPSTLDVVRKASHVISGIKESIHECQHHDQEGLQLSLDELESTLSGHCIKTLIVEVPKIISSFKGHHVLHFIHEILEVKKACL